jgi:hypothetical protein
LGEFVECGGTNIGTLAARRLLTLVGSVKLTV